MKVSDLLVCVACLEIVTALNSDGECSECRPSDDEADASHTMPSAEYLRRWESTY